MRNDIPMLEKGFGNCNENAQEDVFPSADYVTEETIMRMQLQK